MTLRTLAALFVALCLSIGTAAAQCNNPTSGYVPFNCQPGAPPQPGDLVLGGQNSQTVKWTWAQVLNPNGGLLPIATSTTLGMVRPDGTSITVSNGILTAIGGGGGGGVSSVGLVLPGIFTVTGSPVTTSGNLTAALNTVSPNLIFGGPSSGSAAGPTFRALTIADLPSGLAVPGGSTWAVQINGGAGAFAGQSLASGQILIGQASGTPLPESITGGSLSAAGALTYPASALTGTTLNAAITTALGLTSVGTIAIGTWQATLIGPTYGGTGVNNGSKTITLGASLITTGAGVPTLAFPAGSYIYGMPGAAGAFNYTPTGSGITSGHCANFFGTAGAITDAGAACGSGGSLALTDAFGTNFNVTALTAYGMALTGSTPNGILTPATSIRTVTSCSGSNCNVQAGDMGNIIVMNVSGGGTITIPAIGPAVFPNYSQSIVCNISTSPTTIASTPTINGYTPTSIPAPQNGVSTCLGLTSNGTTLQATLFGPAPNAAFLNQAQQWTAPQQTNFTTPAISTATFTPVFSGSQNFRINLVHASCPCTLANPAAIVAGQQGDIEIAQSSTGSDTIGTWGSNYVYSGGTASITLSTTANAVDHLPYAVDSTGTHIVLLGISKGPAH